ncbi:RES family NAD+ phosphorylase [Pseudomonas graminis]|uniref:RES family NAD+ phosphorylase n=1 Tax=Pseudomonas graminis TaxID=158627 RepID=UPI00234B9081|nr:RES family NAD+ phosphorylase [Pseudomonas graminis]MDC6379922.1 RES family NAD+ phosphorylase [Pseudomonas graminis]
MNPVDILEALGSFVGKLRLVDTLSVGEKIFRVRIVDQGQLSTSSDLGAPPHEFATMPNRMSPVGIPMFYGAFDVDTAIRETYDPGNGSGKKAVCGEFSAARILTVIDLTESFIVPSLFDSVEQRLRPYYRFMRDFIKDFMRPIELSEKAHADYVPTQVVTEYSRHIYRTSDGIPSTI